MNDYYGSFEDEELSWIGASWKRSRQLVEQDLEAYKRPSRDFSGEEPEKPTYDPWTGGWF